MHVVLPLLGERVVAGVGALAGLLVVHLMLDRQRVDPAQPPVREPAPEPTGPPMQPPAVEAPASPPAVRAKPSPTPPRMASPAAADAAPEPAPQEPLLIPTGRHRPRKRIRYITHSPPSGTSATGSSPSVSDRRCPPPSNRRQHAGRRISPDSAPAGELRGQSGRWLTVQAPGRADSSLGEDQAELTGLCDQLAGAVP